MFLTLSGCQNKNNSYSKKINKIISHYNVNAENKNLIVFLPLDGCNPCNKKLIEFYNREKNNHKILWIVTATYEKEIFHNLGSKSLKNPNLLYDSIQLSYKSKLIKNRPSIFMFKNDELTYFDNSLQSSEFEKLVKEINQSIQ